jgi:hypothetical protein
MTLKRTAMPVALVILLGITLLQVFVNWGGRVFPAAEAARFRVGFLPVT